MKNQGTYGPNTTKAIKTRHMTGDRMSISVIIPALNEEKNIVSVVTNTLKALDDFNIDGEIIVVDDGSTDATKRLAGDINKDDPRVSIITHKVTRGIGASFWDGVDASKGEITMMLPGDNENDSWESLRYYDLLEHVDIIIPFIYNREVRSTFRNIFSLIYRFIINTTFLVNLNYTNGTVLYRKSLLKKLDSRSDGFFFQTDILIRLVKKHYLFAEVPYMVGIREYGVSNALSYPSLLQVISGYLRLVRDIYFKKGRKHMILLSRDSLTLARRRRKNNNYKS